MFLDEDEEEEDVGDNSETVFVVQIYQIEEGHDIGYEWDTRRSFVLNMIIFEENYNCSFLLDFSKFQWERGVESEAYQRKGETVKYFWGEEDDDGADDSDNDTDNDIIGMSELRNVNSFTQSKSLNQILPQEKHVSGD